MTRLFNRLLRIVTVFCVAVLAVACVQSTTPAQQGPATDAVTPVANTDPAVCKTQGGALQNVCRMGRLLCVIPFKDAGKTCTDKSQCRGECLYAGGDAKSGEAVTGTCQKDNDPCGCKQPILGGKLTNYGRCFD